MRSASTVGSSANTRRAGTARRFARRSLAVIGAICLLLAACGSDEPEAVAQAEESLAPVSTDAVDGRDDDELVTGAAETTDQGATEAQDDGDSTELDAADQPETPESERDEAEDADDPGGLDAATLGDRGLRIPGLELPEDDDVAEPTVAPAAAPEPTSTPAPEPVSVEPTPTPAPTPTSPPLNDPVVPQAQLPQQPVPSDDLQIDGPPTDDGSEIEIISDSGILACATAEAAIEFLDRGDMTRTQQALQSAGALASTASESAIAALATQMSSAGRDSDASFDAIVAMLSACAQYGYEV